ncbi:immunoglobulin gamma-1 heavy chain-like [Varanus komodoensis]|uniref:immunoglobulin gamma-1 heavy chain-like n=1 Tax=Varanus komodoensis TaxID=61221 RepID=UPI001CF76808|nr:immunoglobulin gamma-1 heavy chain-like [Varanus komodoensis]
MMLLRLAGLILLSLLSTHSQRTGIIPRKTEGSLGGTVTLTCNLPVGQPSGRTLVHWYKEKQGRSLDWIFTCSDFSKPDGKYSNRPDTTTRSSLIISNVQRNDSGLYYCVKYNSEHPEFLEGIRLIITDDSRTDFSLLVSPFFEELWHNHTLPLLCLFLDVHPSWKPVSWNTSSKTSQNQLDIGVTEAHGRFSIWSIWLVLPEAPFQGKALGCAAEGNRNFSAIFQKNRKSRSPENCVLKLCLGGPWIPILLLILLLLFRKRCARGNAAQPANPRLMGEIQQTTYAEVHFNNQNMAFTDQSHFSNPS